jgi:hypothetical protein
MMQSIAAGARSGANATPPARRSSCGWLRREMVTDREAKEIVTEAKKW